MRILVDITHPAHVHFFRNALGIWSRKGHQVLVASRAKDITDELLDAFGIAHENLGTARSGLLGLGIELVSRTARLRRLVGSFRPHVMTAIGGVFIAQAGWLTRTPSVVFYDTENATLSNLLTYPFCSAVITPACYEGWVPERKHLRYAGYHELAYTHPHYFRPDPSVLSRFGLSRSEPFIVLRLVSWGAAHDVTDHGITALEQAFRVLEDYGRVLISSERPLPAELETHRLISSPECVLHLLYYARLFIGESATMASESATLGTPAVFISTSVRGYTNELEKRFDLAYTFSDPREGQSRGLAKAIEILDDPRSGELWAKKRGTMLASMIDVTELIVHEVERLGGSSSSASSNP